MDPQPATAESIHRLLVDLFGRIKDHEQTCIDRLAVSRFEAKVLYRLDEHETLPVRALAERVGADPSNLSGPLDGLEARGLIEREAAEHDRRVRAVRLSAAGVELRGQLVTCLLDGHPGVAGLSLGEQEQLLDLLQRLEG